MITRGNVDSINMPYNPKSIPGIPIVLGKGDLHSPMRAAGKTSTWPKPVTPRECKKVRTEAIIRPIARQRNATHIVRGESMNTTPIRKVKIKLMRVMRNRVPAG
jgi:hypothetical protein